MAQAFPIAKYAQTTVTQPRDARRSGPAGGAGAFLESVGRRLSQLVVRARADATITAANEPFCAFVQREPAAVIGAKLPDLFAGSDRETVIESLRSLDAREPTRRRRQRIAIDDGYAEVEWRDRAIVAPGGTVIAFLMRGRRIGRVSANTARGRAEAAELRKRVDDLLAANERLRQFNRIAAHDLVDPVAKVLRGIALLREAGDRPPDPLALRILGAAAQQAADRVSDLLDYCSVSEQPLDRVPLPLSPLLRSIAAEAGVAANLQIDLPQGFAVWGDPRQVRQIFQNLIANAVKYRSPARPCAVRVTLRPGEDEVEICVEDDGVGFPPSAAESLFAPFRRLDPNAQGRGLGLSIAASAAMRHGWSIRAEGRPDQGATFAVRVPLCHVEPEATQFDL